MTPEKNDQEISFVTSNKGKVREFEQILQGVASVKQLDIDYPEMRADDPVEISMQAASALANELCKPIVVEDSGLFISALNDFPGTCSAYIHKRIGLPGILRLLEGVSERGCAYKSAVGYCEPGSDPIAFVGEERGKIALGERGSNGFGHDPIFIPEGSSSTYGEMSDVEEKKMFRRRAVKQLLEFLKSK